MKSIIVKPEKIRATISSTDDVKGRPQRVILSVRENFPWLTGKVRVQVGNGEHQGQLKIFPDAQGPFNVTTRSSSSKQVILCSLPGMKKVKNIQEPLSMKVEGNTLIFILPKWAQPETLIRAVTKEAAKTPYRMLA